MSNILRIQKLIIGYKQSLLPEINFEAKTNDFIAVLGRNGIGKSTFLHTIVGLQKKITGEIFFNEQNVNKISLSEKSKIISYVPSQMHFLLNFSVYDLLAMGRSPYTNIFNKITNKDKEIIEEEVIKFNINQIINKSLSEISDGEKQRAMIARCLVQQTAVIIMDEPTSFLDYYNKQKLFSDLSLCSKEKNKIIILSTHDIELAIKYCDKIWLLGHDTKEYTIEEIKKNEVLKKELSYSFD